MAARPDLAGFDGRDLVVGIRPEDMEDASLASEAPPGRLLRSEVVLSEALGADVLVHFTVKAPPVLSEDVREIAHDTGEEALEAVTHSASRGESNFIARLSPRTQARKGAAVELLVDVERLHFFDPESGRGIYGGDAA
jgi:multiple sugar transport system ATP-binding protein